MDKTRRGHEEKGEEESKEGRENGKEKEGKKSVGEKERNERERTGVGDMGRRRDKGRREAVVETRGGERRGGGEYTKAREQTVERRE